MTEKDELKTLKPFTYFILLTIVLDYFILVGLSIGEELNEKYGNLDALMAKQPIYNLPDYSLPTHGSERGSQYERTVDAPISSQGTTPYKPEGMGWYRNDD